jgi:hypothetical protein
MVRALSVAIMLGLISIDDTLCRPNTWLYELDADVFWLGSGSVLGTRCRAPLQRGQSAFIRLVDKVLRLVSFP